MRLSEEDCRAAFAKWLRTGFVTGVTRGDGVEYKFNPWHDPATGRFTFANTGVFHGGGGNATTDAMGRRPQRPKPDTPGRQRPRGWGDGGFTGGGGGRSGGGGATGPGWPDPPAHRKGPPAPPTRSMPAMAGSVAPSRRASAGDAERFREIVRNGYTYRIDSRGRTRRISGTLTLHRAPRSRSAQSRAGGADRRPGDDGGHYIARRFNGPAEAFNHFAQDGNFNRGRYRALEDEWARERTKGRNVVVKILPVFYERSSRPSVVDVSYWVDEQKKSVKFVNERQGGARGNR